MKPHYRKMLSPYLSARRIDTLARYLDVGGTKTALVRRSPDGKTIRLLRYRYTNDTTMEYRDSKRIVFFSTHNTDAAIAALITMLKDPRALDSTVRKLNSVCIVALTPLQ